jgi:hypothetical protein
VELMKLHHQFHQSLKLEPIKSTAINFINYAKTCIRVFRENGPEGQKHEKTFIKGGAT